MTLYLCLDDRNGMRFNNRRQSRDSAVLEDIRACLPGELTITPFSEKLVRDSGLPYCLAAEALDFLPSDAHVFLEAPASEHLVANADTIVFYRWNRHYPADTYWEMDPFQSGFTLSQTCEFPGTSHKIITKEVYTR